MTKLEEVARAIAAAEHMPPISWETASPDWREMQLRLARAAIKALRGPSEAMVEAGESTRPDAPKDHALAKYLNACQRFDAMIEAAIHEAETEDGGDVGERPCDTEG